MSTSGISPKVYMPVAVNLAVGAIFLALGERELAVGILLAVVSGAGLGYVASPGAVELDPEAVALLLLDDDEDDLGVTSA